MSSYGAKVSRDGYDIRTATVLQQEFNSNHNSLKIGLEGLASQSVNGSATVTITHGLGISPSFLCWFEVNNNGKWFMQYMKERNSGYLGQLKVTSDSTSVYLYITTSSNVTVKVYYVLFYDPSS